MVSYCSVLCSLRKTGVTFFFSPSDTARLFRCLRCRTEDSLQQEELPASSSSDVFFTRIWHVMARLASGAKSLLRNPLYVVITLGMSILYFVVTGIQFWVTEYMVVVLRFNKMTVVALSSLCFLTAPTSG